MATAQFQFNIAKGRVNQLALLPLANDAMFLVWLKSAGLESDATLKDYATLSAILAASNDECDFTGYARKTLTGLTVTPNNASDIQTFDAADVTSMVSTSVTPQTAGACILCYDDDTTSGTDANVIPLLQLLVGTFTFEANSTTPTPFDATGILDAA
jgi:hypothetical protein